MAADAGITVTEYVRQLIKMAVEHFRLTGRHIILSDVVPDHAAFLRTDRPTRSIPQLLEGVNLESLATEIQLPVEKLEAIIAGEFPSDSDLSFLVGADCVPYTLPQLFHARQLQFEQVKEDVRSVHK